MTIWIIVLVVLATLRVTRFFTHDALGKWLIVDRATLWAEQFEYAKKAAIQSEIDELTVSEMNYRNLLREQYLTDLLDEYYGVHTSPLSWQARLVSGLSCPFCIGFWVGAGITGVTWLLVGVEPFMTLWVGILFIFSLNYVIAHISSRLD